MDVNIFLLLNLTTLIPGVYSTWWWRHL